MNRIYVSGRIINESMTEETDENNFLLAILGPNDVRAFTAGNNGAACRVLVIDHFYFSGCDAGPEKEASYRVVAVGPRSRGSSACRRRRYMFRHA